MMMTPSALADSGNAVNDTRTANTIRGRIGIRRMAVSSPGQATLAAAWVRDAAKFFQVPLQLDRFRGTQLQGPLCHRLLQHGEAVTNLLNEGIQLLLFGCRRLIQRVDHSTVVPDRPIAAAFEMRPEIVSVDAVAAEYISHVVEFVGSYDQPDRIRLGPESCDIRRFPLPPGWFRRLVRVRARCDDAGDLIAKAAANLLQRRLAP
jgi:hypothetical protein